MYPAGVFHFQHRLLVAASKRSPGGLYRTGGISTDWGMGCRVVSLSSLHGVGVVSEGEVCFIFIISVFLNVLLLVFLMLQMISIMLSYILYNTKYINRI